MTDDRRADDDAARRALDDLPIFPLPGTVFFPHTLLPLHIFEPRYRQMTQDVIDGHKHMAVVLLDPPTRTAQGAALRESPVVHTAAVAGLGRLVLANDALATLLLKSLACDEAGMH